MRRTVLGPLPLPCDLTFVKFGLAGWAGRDWLSFCMKLSATLPTGCQFVAVAYADWQSCDAPPPKQSPTPPSCIASAFLIDTHDKTEDTLLDHLSMAAIDALTRRCQSAGVPVALAGSLGLAEIERLHDLDPNWFAVRGAACQGGRDGRIDSGLVRRLKETLPSQTWVAAKQ